MSFSVKGLIWFYPGSVNGTVEMYISKKDRNKKFCPACNVIRTLKERSKSKISSVKMSGGAVKADRQFRQTGRTQQGSHIF
jgi:hypothetical protein